MSKPNEAILVRVPADLIELLDEYRRTQEDLPSRPEAMRRIIKERLAK